MKLNLKILLYILTVSIIIYVISVGYISTKSQQTAKQNAIEIVNITAMNYSSKLESLFGSDMAIVRTLANGFSNYSRDTMGIWKEKILDIYKGVFGKTPQFEGLWDSWELNVIDETWNKPTGRISYNLWWENNQIKSGLYTKSIGGDPARYKYIKKLAEEYMSIPYYWSYEGRDSVLLTDMTAPMFDKGKYMGLVGLDITSERCQDLVEEIKPYEGTKAFLIYTSGIVFASSNTDEIFVNIKNIYPELEKEHHLTDKIIAGEQYSFFSVDEFGREYYTVYTPVKTGKAKNMWSLGISTPIDVIMRPVKNDFRTSILIGILSLIALALLTWVIARNITRPLVRITDVIKKLAKGNISESLKMRFKTKDEIGEISDSINYLIDGLNSTAKYATSIGQGKFDSEYSLLSEDDVLGNSLLEMRNSLKSAREEREERKIEDEKQNWVTQGLAMLGEQLRNDTSDINKFSYNILSNFIKYIDANQGGLYLINEDNTEEKFIELIACIAFDRRKYMTKKIQMGEGLVGRCLLEKDIIYLTDLPQSYIKITSGLGDSNPSSLLVAPLIYNDEILGALEIASFNKFEKYEIDFIKKNCESIAASISSVRINVRTSQLLQKSQQQAEEMAAQEEEMRQNMEELQATQENSLRREKELLNYKNALDNSVSTLSLNVDGTITKANELFHSISKLAISEVIGNNFNHLLSKNSKTIDFIHLINQFKSESIVKFNEDIELVNGISLKMSFIPYKDNDEKVTSLLAIGVEM